MIMCARYLLSSLAQRFCGSQFYELSKLLVLLGFCEDSNFGLFFSIFLSMPLTLLRGVEDRV